MEIGTTDVLILGSGLAGLRAALSAQQEAPDLNITVVSATSGPSGSSFANRNDALGMQVCFSREDQEIFAQEASSLAKPGMIIPELVEILTDESLPRFQDLCELGVRFSRDDQGRLCLHSGCFSPDSRRAVVFKNLAQAFACFSSKLVGSVRFLSGWQATGLLKDDSNAPKICGAMLQHIENPDTALAVRSKTTVMALGGPAPLYPWHQAGPSNPGYSLALLNRAGVHLMNHGFLQMMWARASDRSFWSFRSFRPGFLVRQPDGGTRAADPALFEHRTQRISHCPAAYRLADAEMDRFLLEHLDRDGSVQIHSADCGWQTIAPMAHAGNGGAKINAKSQTSLQSLYACGECAAGMHGANRIGGAMVTATQVFGHRAGLFAAREAETLKQADRQSLKKNIACHLARNGIQNTEPPFQKELIGRIQQSPLSNDHSFLSQVSAALGNRLNNLPLTLEQELKLESLQLILADRLNHLLN
jgi:L-aspartate oxidase